MKLIIDAPLALFVAIACHATSLFAVENGAKPNVIVIVADDLGYGDLGFQGGKDVPTPNIDSLAQNGVRFTDGYVTGTVCSPTRAGLLTGRYQQRFGHEFNPGGVDQTAGTMLGLPLSESTIAEAMRQAGYKTALVGKWHLGSEEQLRPLQRGFDEFYGFLGGAHPYVPNKKSGGGGPIYHGNKQINAPEHLTQAFGEEAAAFIEREKGRPYFLLLTFNAVHNPLQPDAEHLARFETINDPKRRGYAGLLSGLDDAVGQVLQAVRESGDEENTLIVFISDNGGPQQHNGSNNAPLRGDKGTVLEGGVRVPFVFQWKGSIPAGSVYEQPVISLDITATAAALAGASLGAADRPIDGVNLIPFVLGKMEGPPHTSLFWRAGSQHAIRRGEYKLVQQAAGPQLYDVVADVGEKQDLAAMKPELVEELSAAYDAWDRQLVPPLWEGGRSGRKPNAANRAGRAERRTKSNTRATPNRPTSVE